MDGLDAETHMNLNFHLSHSQDGLHLGFYDFANGGGSRLLDSSKFLRFMPLSWVRAYIMDRDRFTGPPNLPWL